MDSTIAASFPLGKYYDLTMQWQTPVITAAVYFISVKMLNPPVSTNPSKKTSNANKLATANNTKSTPGKSNVKPDTLLFTLLVFLHNVALCVFSGATFLGMAPAMVSNFLRRPLSEALCDRDGQIWESSLFYWSWLFYLSKYYEIFDTIILLVKGKRSSLLQSYHHSGAIISMWLGVKSRATAIWIFVVFNSFIHTLMYFYYALTTIHIRPPQFLKRNLTRMQITQFLIGGSIASSYLFVPGCMKLAEGLEAFERAAYYVNVFYLMPLTALFVNFFRKSYGERQAALHAKRNDSKGVSLNGDMAKSVESVRMAGKTA